MMPQDQSSQQKILNYSRPMNAAYETMATMVDLRLGENLS
jgi:hypothetical protein